jgi:hexosaminidase
MLDVARHFHPVSTVTAVIDRIAALKLNHLHLHLTDDQGWRLELASHPLLTQRASSTSIDPDRGGHYTQDDYAHIVSYASARHVTVVPEIDVPGHTHAIGLAYPDLVAEPVVTDSVRAVSEATGSSLPESGRPYTGMAVGFSSLRMDDPDVDAFVADAVTELAALTPGPFVHLGGDEALGTDPAAYARFMARATAAATRTGKTPVTWHEAGAAPGLAPGTVGQYWSFTTPVDDAAERARAFVERGGRLILSPADAVYLDMKYDDDTSLGLTWADGPTSVRESYAWEPLRILPGIDDADVLGVEAPLWTETVATLADIDALMFPRIASAAEIAWSRHPDDDPERSWESFRARVAGLAPAWRRAGIGFHAAADLPWTEEGTR